MYQKVNGVQVIKLLLTITPFFQLTLVWSLPVYADAVFPASICVTQKVVTAKDVYILFYDNGTRRIVSQQEFESTNVGDCTWS